MKSCNCYALRAIDCTCLPKKYDEIYTTPDQEPVAWMEMVVANLVREGVNKHKARELAQHFYTHPPQRTWVGLTDEEEQELDEKYGDDINVYIDQRDLKLKEKNT